MECGYQNSCVERDQGCQAPIISRLSPCLLPIQITPTSRCSSQIKDPSKTTLSCGSLSPISPRQSCEDEFMPLMKDVKNVKILVTDSDNNNSVFVNFNDVDSNDNGKLVDPDFLAASKSINRSSSHLENTPSRPIDRKFKSGVVVITLVSISSIGLCLCIWLAVFLGSSVIGVPVAILGFGLIVFVTWFGYSSFRSKPSERRRNEYQRLGGKNYCGCSPSMTNIFYQCSHESDSNIRRGSTASRNFANMSFY